MNTLFGRKTLPVRPKAIKQNFNQEQPKKRKKRSDAKKDIKFKLSNEDKKSLQRKAMNHMLSLTAFASLIVENDLLRDKEYQDYEYDNNGEFVHVVLKEGDFNNIQSLSIEWGISKRRVVHRIVKEYLWIVSGGYTINTYREGRRREV
ncbi:hypothetical protein KHA93_11535 [Bacillus sp. FJAT-49732]|uniref:Uncharacterized protein n=1 Tax=Lederbergia citrisecunda TaxID=2833583 RepID=A0A942TP29_9BACI|nr:hypothetical protein [Lederbergia citrisecunda]MBS4200262.1 hypothetical protein [Lederbergia citrisecunda]